MLATKDVELARETVRDLYARGQVERARAVEAILMQALAASKPRLRAPGEYLTLGQAARALGVRLQTVESWVDAEELPATRHRGRLRVPRGALQSHLDRLREQQQQQPALTPVQEEAVRRQHEMVVAGLPSDRVARLEELVDKLQDGERVGCGERAELAALERELAVVAAERLDEWTQRAVAAPTTS
ncbi:MAG: helix-turn-helix domain-containing protein [Chloroflexi bacterium]|nr:helix-turn-helix domain-containing protein [Chloroflexota bacterium]